MTDALTQPDAVPEREGEYRPAKAMVIMQVTMTQAVLVDIEEGDDLERVGLGVIDAIGDYGRSLVTIEAWAEVDGVSIAGVPCPERQVSGMLPGIPRWCEPHDVRMHDGEAYCYRARQALEVLGLPTTIASTDSEEQH